jgi:hypothetical protein
MTAPTYDNVVKAARMNATRTAVEGGTLELLEDSTVVAIFTLAANGGSVTNGVWTLAFVANEVAATGTGVVNTARIKNSGGTVRISNLSVGTSGTAIVIQNTNIVSGQDIEITSAVINHAPDPE